MDKPWEDEPDYLAGSYGDVPWFIVRGPVGSLCGYIAVNEKHPWWGKSTGIDGPTALDRVDVHGGITWAGWRPGGDDSPITNWHTAWYIGFDCAHSGDLVPGMRFLGFNGSLSLEETYKDIDYVRDQCERLAAQASAAISHRMLSHASDN
jgi:hypothetical protein